MGSGLDFACNGPSILMADAAWAPYDIYRRQLGRWLFSGLHRPAAVGSFPDLPRRYRICCSFPTPQPDCYNDRICPRAPTEGQSVTTISDACSPSEHGYRCRRLSPSPSSHIDGDPSQVTDTGPISTSTSAFQPPTSTTRPLHPVRPN